MKETLTAEQTASFLGTLDIDRLRKLAKKLAVTADDQRSRSSIVEALVAAPRRAVIESLTLPELRDFSAAVGGARDGKKEVLVQRVLHAAQRPAADNRARSEAPASGNDVKAALQRFSLEGPAISGRDAQGRFVRALLACFGWRHHFRAAGNSAILRCQSEKVLPRRLAAHRELLLINANRK